MRFTDLLIYSVLIDEMLVLKVSGAFTGLSKTIKQKSGVFHITKKSRNFQT